MSLKSVDTSEKNTAVLEIEIDKALFADTVSKIFRSKAASLTVPGFRKGKAPRVIIEKMYGKGIFHEDALNELLPQVIDDAVTESKIKPVSRPEIDADEINADNDIIIKAKFTVKPEVTISNYKGLEASKTVITVSDEDIDKEIAKAQKRNVRSIDITDRAAQLEDEVNIDYEGFIDDVPFEGGKGEDHKLKLGSGSFIPGFEEQIVGKNIGDDFDVTVTFPEEYHGEEVKGKEAVFKVKLNSIRFEELPELDDEFAQDVSEFNTFEEYKADVKTKIKESNDKRSEYVVEEQLVDGIVANLAADIPEIMITNEVDNLFNDYAYRMQSQGIDMEMYMKYTGMTAEAIRAQFKDSAERQVKTRLALEYIVAAENIEATEEDIEKEYDKMAEMYKMEKEQLKERVDANIIKEDLAVRKAVEFVKENAVITEVEKSLKEFEEELHEHEHRHHDHSHHDHDDDCDCDDCNDFDDDDDYFDDDEEIEEIEVEAKEIEG